MDTIFARATAPGRSGVAIVRISGPEAHDVATKICGSLPVKRGLRTIRTSEHEVLDEALVLSFENDKSFTGERVVEFHLHGSPAVVQSVMEMLASEHDLRMAEPGEFTRRALENGKLDLAQVEGLADLIDAETEVQRRQALRVFQGSLGDMAEKWRQKLIRAAALIEATIDFADEEIPENVLLEAREILDQVVAELKSECVGVDAAERIREGFEIAIIGEPNVGKSSLINALAKRSVAIVSDVPGTTRDAIEVKMEIAGYPVILVDTAGIRESSDKVERMGIEIARARATQADLRILLYEKTAPSAQNDLSADLVFGTKSDRYSYDGLSISVTTAHGIDTLVSNISDRLKTLAQPAGMAIRKRHKFAMARAIDYLELASRMLHDQASVDIVSDEVRSGISAIDSLVGRVDVEDLLDDIFHSFCIGK